PGRRSKLLRVVGPGAAKHPVVETLAALAEPAAGSVVRSGDVAVQRHGDRRDNTRHGCASTHSGLGTLDEAPSRKSSVCARAARGARSGARGPSGGARNSLSGRGPQSSAGARPARETVARISTISPARVANAATVGGTTSSAKALSRTTSKM